MFGWIFGKKPARPKPGPPTLRASTAAPVERGSLKKAPERKPSVQVLDFGSRILSVPALDFIGLYETSPNGRFRVAWRDGDGNQGGAREHREGAYVLIDVDRVVAHGRMQRPNDGKVADNGNFILNDWRFTAELAGSFWAFRPDGSVILSKSFDANLFNNGLSDDGELAACHTCNSSIEADSAILTLFDLDGAKELTRFRAESGWPSTYRFSKSPGTVVLGYSNDGGDFAYGLDGAFLDREAWIAARLKAGDLYLIRSLFQQAEGRAIPDLINRLIAATEIGLGHSNWRDDRSQAFGYRLQGELLEASGSVADALESYDKALTLDPKIGIKRRVAQLRKQLGGAELA